MNANEESRTPVQEELIELGVASVETKGNFVAGEGMGGKTLPGISEE